MGSITADGLSGFVEDGLIRGEHVGGGAEGRTGSWAAGQPGVRAAAHVKPDTVTGAETGPAGRRSTSTRRTPSPSSSAYLVRDPPTGGTPVPSPRR